jgi:hypothetical protein
MVKKFLTKNVEVFTTSICVRGVREYSLKKKQYLESSGIVTIEEPSGLLITSAVVSGRNNMKDVTDVIKEHVGQLKCPLEIIHIDTGMMNHFTGHDVEPGSQKLLQIEYITNDKTDNERQVCCPDAPCKQKPDCEQEVCCADQHRKPKRRQRYRCCDDIDESRYICLDNVKPSCEKKRRHRRCNDDCEEEKEEEPTIHYHHHHHHTKPRMSSHLHFPLYPIHGPFVTHRVSEHKDNHHHHHPQRHHHHRRGKHHYDSDSDC